jgi:hypothetical protein
MRNGAIVAELNHEEASEEAILAYAVGDPVGASVPD